MPYVPNEDLDLVAGIGQVASTVEFYLLDRTGSFGGQLVNLGTGASIAADITANIPRQLNGFQLASEDYAAIDPFGDRVVAEWFLPRTNVRFRLGEFYFTTSPDDGQIVKHGPLFDKTIVLDSPMEVAFGVGTNTSVTEAIEKICQRFGFDTAGVEGSDVQIGDDQPIGWAAGAQTWAVSLRYLTDLCGFVKPYFDVNGLLHCRAPTDLVVGPATLTYSTENSRVLPSPILDPNLLDAPNVHIVISTGATTEEISAAASVDASLPFSVEHRGYVRAEVHRMQGIANDHQAQLMANQFATTNADTFAAVTFSTPPDPRHELAEVIGYNGVAFRETRWNMNLSPGGQMDHTVSRAGSAEVAL